MWLLDMRTALGEMYLYDMQVLFGEVSERI